MTNPRYRIVLESYFEGDNRALERFVQDRTNSLCEIKLVRARQLLRKGSYPEAFEILATLTPDSAFTRAEVAILKASIHSYQSKWQGAIDEALIAREAYEQSHKHHPEERGLFISNYNLSVYYSRLGEESRAIKCLREAEAWMRTPTQRSLVYRARACEFSARSEFVLAVKEIERALALKAEIDPVDSAALIGVAADIYFRAGEASKAIECLEEIAQSKVIRDKAKVRFDLLVLRGLLRKDKKLVPNVCPEGLSANEEYSLRWEILSALQSGESARASAAWSKLVKAFPLRFRPGFAGVTEADESMLFLQAVRFLQRPPVLVKPRVVRHQNTGKAGKLLELLQLAKTPLRKEEIIERLWEQAYEPTLDNRFYKLMSRLRKESGVRVEVVLNSYRLAE